MDNRVALRALLVATIVVLGGVLGDETMAEDTAEALPKFDELWNFRDPAATEAAFRALVPKARESGDKDYLGQLLSQIARTRGLQRDFDGAHALLDEAEAAITPDCTKARIRILLERGRAFNSGGEKEKSLPLFLEAFVTAHKAGGLDNLMVDAVHMLGIVAEGSSSVQWNVLAIDLAEKSDDELAKRWLGALYNNIGWSFHELGDYDTAKDYWERGVRWHSERKTGRGLLIAKWTIGRVLRSMERYDEAIEKQKALLADYEREGLEEAGYCAEEMGENLLALDRGDEAKLWFARAYEKLSKDEWLKANEADRLARMKELAGDAVTGDDE